MDPQRRPAWSPFFNAECAVAAYSRSTLSLMKASAPTWLAPTGASQEVLRELEAEVGPLPNSYITLLARGNGGEVGLTVNPFTLCLDSAEHVLDYWRSGTYTMEGVFIFGGNGGGSLLAFDLRTAGEWPVVEFDSIDPEGTIATVAPDFEGLLALATDNDG